MDDFIYKQSNSIPKELCDEIIMKYENEKEKKQGTTGKGVDIKVKQTMDFTINQENNEKWNDINNILYNELLKNIKKYDKKLVIDDINPFIIHSNNSSLSETSISIHPQRPQDEKESMNSSRKGKKYNIIPSSTLFDIAFMIQKYDKNVGKYTYHNDFHIDYISKSYRIITFLWYLNDVHEGGETEFWGNYKIKPEAGKLILFPASWTFPHTGKMPLSNDKYIITGWLYQK
jgi:hypothetical protein